MFQVVFLIFLFVFLYVAVRSCWQIWKLPFDGDNEKLGVLKSEPSRALVVAGEAHSKVWREVSDHLKKNSSVEFQVVCGPLSQMALVWYAEEGIPTDKFDFEELINGHPVFSCLAQFSDRFRMYIKNHKDAYDERHFAIGESSGKLFWEFPHQPFEDGNGGRLYSEDTREGQLVVAARKDEFARLIDPNNCLSKEITWEQLQKANRPFPPDYPFNSSKHLLAEASTA